MDSEWKMHVFLYFKHEFMATVRTQKARPLTSNGFLPASFYFGLPQEVNHFVRIMVFGENLDNQNSPLVY